MVFLLVIIILNGSMKAAIEPIPPPTKCDDVKVEVIRIVEAEGAKVLKAECLVVNDI